jgi:hypothetical protein
VRALIKTQRERIVPPHKCAFYSMKHRSRSET